MTSRPPCWAKAHIRATPKQSNQREKRTYGNLTCKSAYIQHVQWSSNVFSNGFSMILWSYILIYLNIMQYFNIFPATRGNGNCGSDFWNFFFQWKYISYHQGRKNSKKTIPLLEVFSHNRWIHNWIIHCEVLLDESISCLHWNAFSIAWICSVPLGQTCGMTSMLFEVLLPWSTSRSSGLPRYDQDEKPSGTHRNQRTPGKNWIRSPTRKVTKRTSDVQSWVKPEASKCIE